MNPFKIDGIVEGDDFMQASGATSSASIKRGLEALETKGVIWQKMQLGSLPIPILDYGSRTRISPHPSPNPHKRLNAWDGMIRESR